ncbi:MAG: nucleotide pyrophosphohydrolase [Candidatus Micrarchaeaceae archaeon]
MNSTDATTTIQTLKDELAAFRSERGWTGLTPRSQAISIVLEAAELVEHFQWDEYDPERKDEIADELANVLTYCLGLANELGIDVAATYRDKLERARQKYPTHIFNPEHTGDKANAAYDHIKKAYRGKA